MRIVICLFLLGAAGAAFAHGVHHEVRSDGAIVVTVTYEDGRPLAFDSYEVAAPGDEPPFQVGRTDRQGRVVFLPDRPGTWQVRVATEDGHGATVPVEVTDDLVVAGQASAGGPGRLWKLGAGAGVLFGLFGIVALIQRRKPA